MPRWGEEPAPEHSQRAVRPGAPGELQEGDRPCPQVSVLHWKIYWNSFIFPKIITTALSILYCRLLTLTSIFRLVRQANCIKVPKEVCVMAKTNPKKVSGNLFLGRCCWLFRTLYIRRKKYILVWGIAADRKLSKLYYFVFTLKQEKKLSVISWNFLMNSRNSINILLICYHWRNKCPYMQLEYM